MAQPRAVSPRRGKAGRSTQGAWVRDRGSTWRCCGCVSGSHLHNPSSNISPPVLTSCQHLALGKVAEGGSLLENVLEEQLPLPLGAGLSSFDRPSRAQHAWAGRRTQGLRTTAPLPIGPPGGISPREWDRTSPPHRLCLWGAWGLCSRDGCNPPSHPGFCRERRLKSQPLLRGPGRCSLEEGRAALVLLGLWAFSNHCWCPPRWGPTLLVFLLPL